MRGRHEAPHLSAWGATKAFVGIVGLVLLSLLVLAVILMVGLYVFARALTP